MLFLGSAESIGNFTNLFAPVAGKSRLFQRKGVPLRSVPVEFPSAFVSASKHKNMAAPSNLPAPMPANLQSVAELWLLQNQAAAAVLTNDQGDILFVSGRTGRYLEPAAGKATGISLSWRAMGCAPGSPPPFRRRKDNRRRSACPAFRWA